VLKLGESMGEAVDHPDKPGDDDVEVGDDYRAGMSNF
jgi:hypothetical protein